MTVSDAHIHDQPDFLQHHFDTPRQQFEAGKLGMWLFLATEVLLFGGLFCAYAVWRGNHPDLFKYGSQSLNTALGAINTVVLIASSLTMAAAVTMAQQGRRRALVLFLTLTLAGAATFLVIKYFEYTHKFHKGIYPGLAYYESPKAAELAPAGPEAAAPMPAPVFADLPAHEPSAVASAAAGPTGVDAGALAGHGAEQAPLPAPRNAHMFYNIYFLMTGLHGLHVLAGGVMLGWLIVGAARGRFGAAYFTPVDLGGLYWHVVDLIWIFLFPLFYLI
ncbi:MAG: cytochrome c oxidase subunit 3 family protein [Planctomycetota bacterium]|jgi:cytochrome c oxidase subunit 3